MKSLKIFLIPLLLFSGYKIAVAEFPVVKQLADGILQLGMSTSSYQYYDHSDEDACFATTVDSSGNYYCAGGTYGALGEENGGNQDAFVMKVNSAGEIVWTRQLGATTKVVDNEDYNSDHDACLSVAVDSSGNVYCGGRTNGDLGEANGGDDDLFVMKLDSNGGLLWVKQFGDITKGPGGDTGEDDACAGLAVDSAGNIYCGGYTAGSIGEANGDDRGAGVDALVLKLDPNGGLLWVKQLGIATTVPGGDTSKFDECKGIAVDTSGNAYCAGSTEGNLGEPNAGGRDLFVWKLDASGNLNWIKQLGQTTKGPGGDNTDDDECAGVAVDTSGNVYCAGATEGSLGEANGGNGDAFVLKFDSAGALTWVTQLGTTTMGPGGDNGKEDRCNSIAVDSSGNVYCAGETAGSISESNAGQEDVFAIKLDSAGTLVSTMQLGVESNKPRGDNGEASNEDQDKCHGVAVDTSGNVYCAGQTTGHLGELNGGAADAFVMKFQFCEGEGCEPEPELPPCQGTETEGCEPVPELPPCQGTETEGCEPVPPTGGEPPAECANVDQGDTDEVEQCCATTWSTISPAVCYAVCGIVGENPTWCCDGTVQPEPISCGEIELPPCEGTQTVGCIPEPDPCDASPTDPACEPETDPCDASPTDPACEPETDPCDASPTDPACEEPGDCPGTVTDDGLCVPPVNCNTVSDPDIDVEACCNYNWDVNSPDICYAFCSRADDRNTNAWCCDGTVNPPLPACDRTNLTKKDLNSMLKTLGIRL